jgi:putative peptidoglycan lipid II flippase
MARLKALTTSRISTPNRSIFFSAIIVGSMTFIVKFAALAKDLVVANNFGVSKELDAYIVAFILPSFVINVVAGAFHTSLVPTYIEVRENEGQAAAQEVFSGILARALMILGACIILLALFGPIVLPLLGSGFASETLVQSQTMFYIMLPSVIISGLAIILGATLNSGDKYALAAIAPLAVPLATMIILVLTINILGVYALAVGLVVGFCVQASLLGTSLRGHQISLVPRWRTKYSSAVNQVMHQFLPAAASAILITSNELIDQSMATPLGAGSVSALNYGIKLLAFLIAIGSTALSVTVLTHFSKLVAAHEWGTIRHTFKTYSRLIIVVTIPLALIFAVFSEPMVKLLYERGAFTESDTILVSRIQTAFFLHFPFYLLVTLTSRLLSSLKMQSVFFWGAILNLITNVGLNYVFTRWFGVVGIALSTSIVYMISFCFLLSVLLIKLRQVEKESQLDVL